MSRPIARPRDARQDKPRWVMILLLWGATSRRFEHPIVDRQASGWNTNGFTARPVGDAPIQCCVNMASEPTLRAKRRRIGFDDPEVNIDCCRGCNCCLCLQHRDEPSGSGRASLRRPDATCAPSRHRQFSAPAHRPAPASARRRPLVAQRRPLVACARAKLGARSARSAVFAVGTFSRPVVACARAKLARPRPLVVADSNLSGAR